MGVLLVFWDVRPLVSVLDFEEAIGFEGIDKGAGGPMTLEVPTLCLSEAGGGSCREETPEEKEA